MWGWEKTTRLGGRVMEAFKGSQTFFCSQLSLSFQTVGGSYLSIKQRFREQTPGHDFWQSQLLWDESVVDLFPSFENDSIESHRETFMWEPDSKLLHFNHDSECFSDFWDNSNGHENILKCQKVKPSL